MKIGVLAEPSDTCARELASKLGEFSGRPCPVFDLKVQPGTEVCMDRSRIEWAGINLADFDKIVVAGFDFEDPQVPRATPSADWGVWQIDYIVDQQRRSFVTSVLRDLERRGVRLVNSWQALQLGFAKARMLGELQRGGYWVPPWLCSNETAVVRRFCDLHERVVWRPNAGGAMWQLFTERQLDHLVDPAKPPVLLAAHPEQAFVNAFVCEGEVLLELDCSRPHIETYEYMEEVEVREIGSAAGELARAVAHVNAGWAQVTYVMKDGRPCIYEITADPRYGWLPAPFRAYLQTHLARKLLGLPRAGSDDLPAPQRGERDSLFVRRMLVALHELEDTKYPHVPPTL